VQTTISALLKYSPFFPLRTYKLNLKMNNKIFETDTRKVLRLFSFLLSFFFSDSIVLPGAVVLQKTTSRLKSRRRAV